MKIDNTAILVFAYENYRDFLRDKFAELKEAKKQFSHRYFAKQAGLASTNFAHMVINGKRNLSKETVIKFAQALEMNAKEQDYFENLVFMNQSKSLQEKNFYAKKLLRHRKTDREIKKLEKLEYEYCSKWYIPVIREMTELQDFKDEPTWVARRICPQITLAEARNALKVLKELHLLVEQDGVLVKRERSLSTGEEIRSVAVKNLHQELISLARESIERFPSDKRDISALTLSMTREQFATVKKKIVAFRKDLLAYLTEDVNAELIYQFNLQLFPLISE